MSKEVVVLLSGGLDSTICLFKSANDISITKIHALSFNYGQRNNRELVQACKIVEVARNSYDEDLITHVVLPIPALSCLADGGLTDHDVDLESNHEKATEYSSAFVPGRNLLFLSTAAAYAYKVGASEIVIGCSRQGYPDSKEEFMDSMSESICVGMDKKISIRTPMANLTKHDRLLMAKKMVGCWDALGYSYSCYEGRDIACGKCLACRKRYWAFQKFGANDPCKYTVAPEYWEYKGE